MIFPAFLFQTVLLLELFYVTTATQSFSYSGSDQQYTVPNDVYTLEVRLWGAAGGAGFEHTSCCAGGSGGFTHCQLPVTPGETLTVIVGQGGMRQGPYGMSPTMYGGGGSAVGEYSENRGAGGGRSAIQRHNEDIVTAGGGGGGGAFAGGGGGYPTGQTAEGNGGKGGSQSGGGKAGQAGFPGSKYVGANAPIGVKNPGAGGSGGGGGYYGGGSASGYGAGGGSSYLGDCVGISSIYQNFDEYFPGGNIGLPRINSPGGHGYVVIAPVTGQPQPPTPSAEPSINYDTTTTLVVNDASSLTILLGSIIVTMVFTSLCFLGVFYVCRYQQNNRNKYSPTLFFAAATTTSFPTPSLASRWNILNRAGPFSHQYQMVPIGEAAVEVSPVAIITSDVMGKV